jgi:hypothetical protein
MINQLEWTRLEAERFRKMLQAEKADDSLLDTAADLRRKADSVEALLLQPTITEEDQKSFRGPLGLYLKFIWLNAEAATGAADVSGNADFAPTQPEREVFALLDRGLEEARQKFKALYEETIPAFNRSAEAKGAGTLVPVKEVLPEFPPEKEKKEEDED